MTGVRKAVIPAAGLGTRFLPATKAQPKEMLPVVHKPVIQYVVEEAVASGIKDILIVTGKGKRAIEDHFDTGIKNEHTDELERILESVNILYIRQKEAKGLGDATYRAKSFVDDEPFALLLGDTITIPPCTKEIIEKYNEYKTSIISVENVPKEKISSYGIINGKNVEDSMYMIQDLIEKPKPEEAPSSIGIIGRYILTPEIFDCIEKTPSGKSGEIQLTDALCLLKEKEKMYACVYSGRRYDIGTKLDWLKANIELSLKDEEFGDELKKFLTGLLT